METNTASCPRCSTPVRITISPGPSMSGGQANLPDGHDIVCLDFHESCAEGKCPLFGVSGLVMGVRLAKSNLRTEEWETVPGICDGCGHTVELKVIDIDHAYCSDCGCTNQWAVVDLQDESQVTIMEKKWEGEGGPPY